jgi:hypothetical protein
MKKNFKFLIPLMLLFAAFFVACDKDAITSSDFPSAEISEDADYNNDDYEYDVDFPSELEDRAVSLTSVELMNAGDGDFTKVLAGDVCRKDNYVGKVVVDEGEDGYSVLLKGTDFPAALTVISPKAGVTSKAVTVKVVSKQSGANGFSDTTTLSDLAIVAPGIISGNMDYIKRKGISIDPVDSMRTFSVKFIAEIPVLNKDSTISIKTKTKSLPCVGRDAGYRFGTFDWDVNKLLRNGNSKILPTSGNFAVVNSILGSRSATATAFDSTKTFKVGEILYPTSGEDRQGLVVAVSPADAKGIVNVRVHERICGTATLRKSTYKFYTKKVVTTTSTKETGFLRKGGSRADTDATIWTKVKAL